MKLNLIGPFVVNAPFGTEIAFAKGLRRLGHEVIEVDPNLRDYTEPDGDAAATVVFKSCVGLEDRMLALPHPIIVYQPDDARFPHIRQMMLNMRRYADLFLSFDSHGADVAKSMGYKAAETLLLTADDELYCPSPEPLEKDIDICFIGSMGDPVAHASRNKMCQIVKAEADKQGWKFVYGQTRNEDIAKVVDAYRRSKVVINHATDVGQPFGYGYGLQCRHFEVGMTKTALVTNKRYGIGPNLPDSQFWDEESLLAILRYELSHESIWRDSGQYLYEEIQESHMPQHRAAQLVDFIQRNA